MNGVTIHTTAPFDLLFSIVEDVPGVTVVHGEAAGGGPDCMFGWGEPQRPGCVVHNMIQTHDQSRWIVPITRLLVAGGFQVVTTTTEDFAEIVNRGAFRYDDLHTH